MIKQIKELKLSSRNRHCSQVGSIACNTKLCDVGTPISPKQLLSAYLIIKNKTTL